jgi:hypothetical protein
MNRVNSYVMVHIIQQGNIEGGALMALIPQIKIGVEHKLIVYSDPPWGRSIYAHFQKQAGLTVWDYDKFMVNYCAGIIEADPSIIFIEHGVKFADEFLAVAKRAGFPPMVGSYKVWYGARKPSLLMVFCNQDLPKEFNPSGLGGEPMTDYVFHSLITLGILKKGDAVLDPCLGKGMTLRMAMKYGLDCYGLELVKGRLEVSLNTLNKG